MVILSLGLAGDADGALGCPHPLSGLFIGALLKVDVVFTIFLLVEALGVSWHIDLARGFSIDGDNQEATKHDVDELATSPIARLGAEPSIFPASFTYRRTSTSSFHVSSKAHANISHRRVF
jgi:hypothetical protein